MRDMVPGALNFLNKGDQHFKALHTSLDSLFRDLRTKNIGTQVRHAEIFTKEEGQMLWDKGILGTSTPQSLLNAVFYLNGKSFCLRGGKNIGDCAFYSLFVTTTQIVMYIQKLGPRTEKAHSWKCTSRTKWYQSIHHHKQVKDAMFIFGAPKAPLYCFQK